MPWPQPINFSTAQRFLCLSPLTRHFFLTNNHTPRDTIPRTRLAVAQARGPTGPHFVVAKVKPGSRTRNRKADRIKNITALMMNELGSIRLPPGISRLLFSTAYLLNIFFGPALTIQPFNVPEAMTRPHFRFPTAFVRSTTKKSSSAFCQRRLLWLGRAVIQSGSK